MLQTVFLFQLGIRRGGIADKELFARLTFRAFTDFHPVQAKVLGDLYGQGHYIIIIVQLATHIPQLEQKDSLEHVMRLINKLPGLQQTILRMKHVDGFEVEEIAGLTGSTPEAVRMNLSRARKRVREQFFKMQTL